MEKKDNKDYYNYYFIDGTKSTVTAAEVGQAWIDILEEMDEEDRKQTYNYNRHNYPLSKVDYEGEKFIDPDLTPLDNLLLNAEQEEVNAILAKLTVPQRKLYDKIFEEDKKATKIAEEQGVCHQAISARLDRIKNKLAKILGLDRSETGFSSLYSEGCERRK